MTLTLTLTLTPTLTLPLTLITLTLPLTMPPSSTTEVMEADEFVRRLSVPRGDAGDERVYMQASY